MYLLDTNVLSEEIRPAPDGRVTARLFALRQGYLFASEITRYELRFGSCLRQDAAAFWLRLQRDELPIVNWLALDQAISERAGEISADLRRRGREAGTVDPLLAATAVVHGLTLVTRNVRHFENIPGLPVENWFEGD